MTTYIGIDPGLTGAVAFLSPAGARVFDLPAVALPGEGKVRRRVDGRGLYAILMREAAGDQCIAGIEALATGGMRNGNFNALQTQNSQHRTRGAIETVLELAGLNVIDIPPKAWKGMYGLGGKKDDFEAVDKALALAAQFYPELMSDVDRKKDHNRAEAILLAHYLRRKSELAEDSRQRAAESVL